MLKLNSNKAKAYGGGVGSVASFFATNEFTDNLTVIIVWLLSFLGEPPEIVVSALVFFIQLAVSYGVGYLITYWSPPNQMTVERRPASLDTVRLDKGE